METQQIEKAEKPVLPEKKFRAGAVSATIWRNERQKDGQVFSYPSISLDRSYKDQSGEWKNSSSLRAADIPKAVLVLSEAFRYLVLNNPSIIEE